MFDSFSLPCQCSFAFLASFTWRETMVTELETSFSFSGAQPPLTRLSLSSVYAGQIITQLMRCQWVSHLKRIAHSLCIRDILHQLILSNNLLGVVFCNGKISYLYRLSPLFLIAIKTPVHRHIQAKPPLPLLFVIGVQILVHGPIQVKPHYLPFLPWQSKY